jgi:hypothetical protein
MRLVDAIHTYDGFSYGAMNVSARTIDCCSFVASVILKARGPRPHDWWRRMNLWPEERPSPWAPCYGAAEAYRLTDGHVQLPHDRYPTDGDSDLAWQPWSPPLGRWLVCQGWRRLDGAVDGKGDRGHTFFWVSHPGKRWRGWVVESNKPHGPQVRAGNWHEPLVDASWGAAGFPLGEPANWGETIAPYKAGLACVTLPRDA